MSVNNSINKQSIHFYIETASASNSIGGILPVDRRLAAQADDLVNKLTPCKFDILCDGRDLG